MTEGASLPEREAEVEVVFTANGEIEAQAIRSALVAAGIPAELKMEAAQQLFAVTVDGLGAIKVVVPAGRADEARAIIANPATPVENETETPSPDEPEDAS